MAHLKELVRFGYSPTMLFPSAFTDPYEHFVCLRIGCSYPGYETLDSFLPKDPEFRKRALQVIRVHGKLLNYNTPGYFHEDGPYNACSDDPAWRASALADMKLHVDLAGEAESPVFVITGSRDQGAERRPELMKRYEEFFLQVAEHAKQYPMRILLEPIERHRFKRLLLGPSAECARFIREMRAQGADNCGLMLDFAHLPLMEESMEEALEGHGDVGFEHVHLGDAVLDPENPLYGHTHPPLGVHGSLYAQEDLVKQFVALFECGFIPKRAGEGRASISLEVRPYPGSFEATSIQLMYEKCESAFNEAAGRLGI